jgi:hypothetical protein
MSAYKPALQSIMDLHHVTCGFVFPSSDRNVLATVKLVKIEVQHYIVQAVCSPHLIICYDLQIWVTLPAWVIPVV